MVVPVTAFIQGINTLHPGVSQRLSIESLNSGYFPIPELHTNVVLATSQVMFQPATGSSAAAKLSLAAGNDVLGPTDVGVGVVLAVGLAFLGSYLQGRRNNQDIVLWNHASNDEDSGISSNENSTLFDGEAWEEMSREENYVYYNTRIRNQLAGELRPSPSNIVPKEKKWVIIGLLLLFVPIFSAEFFLALSRGILCELFGDSNLAQQLCAPAPPYGS